MAARFRSSWLEHLACTEQGTTNADPEARRVRSAAQALALLRPLLGQFGITRLANLTGLDRVGMPVWSAIRPQSRSVAVSMGKGLDDDRARVAALMESIETWHAERIDRPLVYASTTEMRRRGRVLEVERLRRAAPDRPLDAARRLLWIEGEELQEGGRVWLPFESVHTDFTLPFPPGSGLFPAETNGLASGNNRLEALLGGLYELVERDALARWLDLGPQARADTRVRPDTLEDTGVRNLLERLDAVGIAAAIWSIGPAIGPPAFRAIVFDGVDPAGHVGIGHGCHASRTGALRRALTEALQIRLTYVSGARDDLPASEFAIGAMVQRAGAVQRLLLAPPRLAFAAVPDASGATLLDDLEAVLGGLAANGHREVAAVDLSRTDLPVAVVRVVVPGLRMGLSE